MRERLGLCHPQSRLREFLDASEAATRAGQTVIPFSTFVTPNTPYFGAYHSILRHCKRVGSLEYVWKKCHRPFPK